MRDTPISIDLGLAAWVAGALATRPFVHLGALMAYLGITFRC